MRRADLQVERSAALRQGPVGGGAGLLPVQDSDVVRDGDTYYLVINNLGERCLRRTFVSLVGLLTEALFSPSGSLELLQLFSSMLSTWPPSIFPTPTFSLDPTEP